MASTPIISVWLIISSVMAPFEGIKVTEGQVLDTSNIIQIYLSEDGLIWVDDQPLENIDQISEVVKDKLQKSIDPGKMKIQFKSDQYTTMDFIQKMHNQLREANALKISYQAKKPAT